MPALVLPLSFTNSFWSQDYGRGLDVVYTKLEQGISENAEIVNFINARVAAERNLAVTLTNPAATGPGGTGFDADDGASLMVTFRGLQHESVAQGNAHNIIANDLQSHVAQPFEAWALQHAERIHKSREDIIEEWLGDYKEAVAEVARLREAYLSKSHKADEAEDDAKFAPGLLSENYTASPRLGPQSGIQRSGTVSERISQRLKEFGITGGSSTKEANNQDTAEKDEDGETTPKTDKGKGREIIGSPQAMSPLPGQASLPELAVTTAPEPGTILLGEMTIAASAISALLFRAQTELPLRNVRFTLLGEYEHCFSGEEFVTWLKDQVPGFDGNLDKTELAARDLTERENALRRVGEFGNKFENSPTAYYQFRPKAFNLQGAQSRSASSEEASPLTPVTNTMLQRSGTIVSYLQKTLATGPTEHPYIKAKMEADAADKVYKTAVRRLDQARLQLEEKVEDILKALQRWETDRLRAVKTVLLQYQGTLATLSGPLQQSFDKSSILISSFIPENDVNALIERYRTGPFRPLPHVYESVTHDGTDVSFGIDLRKWAAEGAFARPVKSPSSGSFSPEDLKPKETMPPVLIGLLQGLTQTYAKLPSDDDRRKAWIYEVPLKTVHHLREQLNAFPPDSPVPEDFWSRYDAPVIASTLKLWALELNPPLALWEGWEDMRKIYPSMGADKAKDRNVIEDLKNALLRLPKVHLSVLDAIVSHLKNLIDTTTTEEANDIYLTKLSLAMGRSIIRPRVENSLTVQDNLPKLLLVDLIKNYDAILPPTISRKKRESDRVVPTRKRTKMVDTRLSRKSVGESHDPRKLLEAQIAAQQGRGPSPAPPAGRQPSSVSSPPASTGSRIQAPSARPPARETSNANVVVDAASPVNLNEPLPAPQPVPAFIPPPPPPAIPKPSSGSARPPSFASPPPSPPTGAAALAEHAPEPVVSPESPSPPNRAGSPREYSPVRRDSFGKGSTGLSRTGSASATGGLRGPRAPLRGARPPPGPPPNQVNIGATSGLVRPSQLRGSGGSPGMGSGNSGRQTPPNPSDYAPRKNVGRSSAGSFSRTRPVASGSEDEGGR